MKKRVEFISAFLLLCISTAIAQERVFIDFGSRNEDFASQQPVNNISTSFQSGYSNGVLLFNQQGTSSGINLQVHDAWLNINTSGTTTPDYQLALLKNESRDSFFGATGSFNGTTEATGGFKLRQLDASKYYSFSFFASRMNVTDNRETTYTITGNGVQTVSLNAANNTGLKTYAYNVQPDANGQITVTATAGINNTNNSGFYYLNAVELQVSNAPISQFTSQNILQLNYPTQNATWEIGKTVSLLWHSENNDMITIAYSTDGGSNYSTVASVPATDGSYDFIVPSQLSNNAVIKISNGSQILQSGPIKIIPNDGTVYRIVVLGSSTAAGSGPSNRYNAWVWKYRRFLKQLDTRYEIINLSQGGFVTYNILPSGSTIPAGVNKTIDIDKNITKAISLNAHGIIINLPSNDAASNYPVTNQLTNYNNIAQVASQNQIPLWVTTPQPRNFGNNNSQVAIQTQMVIETYTAFGNNTVDFWSGLGNASGNGILLPFDSGDGVHATNEAHQIFYERIIAKNIHDTVKLNVDTALSTDNEDETIVKLYPNPVTDLLLIESNLKIDHIIIYDQLGQMVLKKKVHLNMINLKELNSGFYIINLIGESINYQTRLLKK